MTKISIPNTQKLFLLLLLLITHRVYAQEHIGIGYTGAWLNSKNSIAGGLSLYVGHDFLKFLNSSFSISTNLKLGIEDKIGSGLIVPIVIVFAASGATTSSVNTDKADGGKVHLFSEVPLLIHYNFGLGSDKEKHTRLSLKSGIYFGGGIDYVTTGFTDTAGFSKGTSFFGYVIDAGIRFMKHVDINFATVFSLRQPIGQINQPMFYEITLSSFF